VSHIISDSYDLVNVYRNVYIYVCIYLLLALLMGLYCFARWCLSSSVTLPAGGRTGRRVRGQSGGRHCMAGQYITSR